MTFLRSIIFILLLSTQALSQQVSVQMPQSKGFVGVPMQLVVVFENIKKTVDPTLPEVDGFTIKRLPNEQGSQRTTIINGKMTHSKTRAITFLLTPKRAGVFTLPVLIFSADGKNFQSTPLTITIEDPPTGGALKVEISGTDDDVYLGEPIDLTLKVFIESFTDQKLGITLNARDMVSLLRGEFGIFKDAIDEGQIQLQEVRGTTDAGFPTMFYVLSVHATTWPETSGPFTMEPVSVLMNYPLSLVKERGFGFFGGESLKVEQSHLIKAQGEMPTIEVLAPPSADKPAWYSGAVGTYDFRMVADPTHVKIGEQITLTMRITDRTMGPINLDFLSAPHLDRVPALTTHFRVPDTPLGGIIEGRTKTFTQSIRPRSDGVTKIPPLPMSSYDPISETYQTVWTKPISITVDPVATVSAGDLVSDIPSTTSITMLTEVDGGILANYTGEDLLKSHRISLSPLLIATVSLPPCTFASILCVIVYRRRTKKSRLSKKGRIRHATTSIRRAITLDGGQQVQTLSIALRELQDVKSGSNFSMEIDALLTRCDAMQFGGFDDVTLAKDAETLMEAIR
jgi:hypothetical protein